MYTQVLQATVRRLLAPPKGILAIDESVETCNKRFAALAIAETAEKRRAYRDLIIRTPEIEKYISGMILYDETIRQTALDGESFAHILKKKGIEVGIKVDMGTKDFALHPGEKITEGLDNLRGRLAEYKALGATFAKWRAVITIGEGLPTQADLHANADALAGYSALCQEQEIVPVVEPEVLMDGDHSIERCFEVTAQNLDVLFSELKALDVYIPGVILKTNMVLAGKGAPAQSSIEEVAEYTLKCLKEHVPENIGGIVFLSGGQEEEESTLHLNVMHQMGALPWPLTFSYARAIQNDALTYWATHPDDISHAQALLLKRAEANSLASIGKYQS